MRKSLFIGLLALSSTMIFAQNQEQRIKEPEKITFKPHWFIQAQIGSLSLYVPALAVKLYHLPPK